MTSSTKGKNDMNDGIAMLIDRMKTNPEEFVAEVQYGMTKWNNLLAEYRGYLDKEDMEAFDAAHKATIFEYMKQRFTEKVMEELIDPKSRSGVTLSPYATSTGITFNAPANSLTIRNTTLTEESIKRILKNQSSTPIAGVTQTI